jgi:hypothetical protein
VNYHLICVHPFGKYVKGQKITDPALVEQLRKARDRHFVKIPAPAAESAKAE